MRSDVSLGCRCDQLGEELEAEQLEVEVRRSGRQQGRLCEAGQTERGAGGGLGKYRSAAHSELTPSLPVVTL